MVDWSIEDVADIIRRCVSAPAIAAATIARINGVDFEPACTSAGPMRHEATDLRA
jgi:hypothetical protein